MKAWIVLSGVVILIVSLGVVVIGKDHDSPKEVLERMIQAAKADDHDKVMACYTRETRCNLRELEDLTRKMGGGACNGNLAEQFRNGIPVFGDQRINGDQASLEVTLNNSVETVQFVKEKTDWKITIPELETAVQMMRGMGGQMQEMVDGMADAMSKAMEESMKEWGDTFGDAMKEMEEMRNQ
ncbi:MAG: hypothetical protein KJ645_06835 [Planctomycetes bacterium]|nr:hypothetical protein [Planctomycetota bacterium]